MDIRFDDRVAIVTGGSSGIGYAIAGVLAREGARVVITARRREPLSDAARTLSSDTGSRVLDVVSDVTDQDQVDRMVAVVCETYSRIDILVNCAANPTAPVCDSIEEMDSSALLQDLNTKVVGYARCIKAVAPAMKRHRWGRIVNIGGLTGRGSATLSGMRNVAICHLTKTLSDQLGPSGITVNTVHPGVVGTPHLTELFESEARKRGCTPAEVESSYVVNTPVRRVLGAEEIANAVAFLVSPLAAAVTGESIGVDGGITRGIYL
jgi:NAD(P)-dependent dehydrogenase (short-subunit alcohol dehydrogenase family)